MKDFDALFPKYKKSKKTEIIWSEESFHADFPSGFINNLLSTLFSAVLFCNFDIVFKIPEVLI